VDDELEYAGENGGKESGTKMAGRRLLHFQSAPIFLSRISQRSICVSSSLKFGGYDQLNNNKHLSFMYSIEWA